MSDIKPRIIVGNTQGGHQVPVEVVCLDEPGAGGACHKYMMTPSGCHESSQVIKFQEGPVKEAGFNGISHEALIAILIDRLEHFQCGDFACRENALALTKLQESQHWLNHRTAERIAAGTEGFNKK